MMMMIIPKIDFFNVGQFGFCKVTEDPKKNLSLCKMILLDNQLTVDLF